MRTAVVTVVHGRHSHLRLQVRGVARGKSTPDSHIVVALNDPDVAGVLADEGYRASVVNCPAGPQLPLAAARNQGAATALRDGAELLVFLDVDCIPSTRLIERYQRTAEHPEHADALLCGPVTYLDPPPASGYDISNLDRCIDPHPARPAPPDDVVLPAADHSLFWSLSFALTKTTWNTIGGFCEDYRGYGGEDTDFAKQAAAQGVPMYWVGGAHAFHQYHPVDSPPVRHIDDIVRNANIFHRRWGTWPMGGWLDAFEADGLIERRSDGTLARR